LPSAPNEAITAEVIRDFLADRTGPPSVTLVVEDEPQGTAGTVRTNSRFVDGEESFWILYADNLTTASLRRMLATHWRHTGLMTLGLFHAPVPSAAGIVQMGADGRIVAFEEKPAKPAGDLANAGIYLARADLLDELPLPAAPGQVLDFGFHVLPALVGRMYGHVIEEFFIDIGTPTALERASAGWANQGRAVT
jgi:NDP-sugar pyrophosphorylase family protein